MSKYFVAVMLLVVLAACLLPFVQSQSTAGLVDAMSDEAKYLAGKPTGLRVR